MQLSELTSAMPMCRKLPEIVYVGLKRSASTFMRGYFDGHPQVVWQRESLFIMDDEMYGKYRGDLTREVPTDSVFVEVNELLATGLIAEAGDSWEAYRTSPDASLIAAGCRVDPIEMAHRVKQVCPDAKIVLTLRNQIDWIVTHYRVFMGLMPARRYRLVDFLSTLEGQVVVYGGYFYKTVQAYFDYFGRDRVFIALFEDIRDSEREALAALCKFMGIEPLEYDSRFRRYNRGPGNADVRIKRWLSSIGIDPDDFGSLKPLGKKFSSMLPKKVMERDVLTAGERRMLNAFYSVSNHHTARLLGIDLGQRGYPW
jgi:hypothetical protein